MQDNYQTTVAVLYGGTSPEREVSLRSGSAVSTALVQAGYHVRAIDTGPIQEDELLAALAGSDVVFPVLHGAGGEDGSVQNWLEDHGFRYVGTGSRASANCFDKFTYKNRVAKLGISLPAGELISLATFPTSALMQKPFVLKPNDGGSSVDTFIVRDPASADFDAMLAALRKYDQMLLEELILGTEITVGVVASEVLSVIEIIPPADGEFDYENKYNGKSRELCPPENIALDVQRRAQEIALKISRELGVDALSRTDMMIRASDNSIFVLETNTIPGMTDQSLLPKAAAAAGYNMPELVAKLVRTVVK